MTRWNIGKILLFSHDNKRRDVTFALGAVNIITGQSHSGKSALTEIIDYVMGSSECHIPSFVRDSCSWFGLLWVKGETQFLICRKAPTGNRKADPDFYVDIGSDLPLPEGADDLQRNRDLRGALGAFENLLGIPDIKVDASAPARPKESITFRHVLPFLLQDDSTIIDKSRLLWHSGEDKRDEKRDAQIKRMPFFLGAVDVETVALEEELARFRRQLRLAKQRSAEAKRLIGEVTERSQALLSEAISVGLTDRLPEDATLETLATRLREVAGWQPLGTAVQEQATNTVLEDLYRQKEQLEEGLSRLRARARSTEQLAGITGSFRQSSEAQRSRLEVITLIPEQEAATTCPTCAQSLDLVSASVAEVQEVYTRIRGELEEVERQRPRLSQRATALREEIDQQREQLSQIRGRIRAVVSEDEASQGRLELEQRQMRVVGRISLYLETLSNDQDPEPREDNTGELRRKIRELEEQLDAEAKREALEEKRILISSEATQIVNRLPFDEQYRGARIDFNPRDLSVGIITSKRRESMRNIGSDENYLSLHLGVMLALHRYLGEAERPVPGVLLLDQMSRPYFPQDTEEEIEITGDDQERAALQQYFDLLFEEADRGESMQFIVLEHAYFRDDARYVAATRERWIEGEEFLIPKDWPETS